MSGSKSSVRVESCSHLSIEKVRCHFLSKVYGSFKSYTHTLHVSNCVRRITEA